MLAISWATMFCLRLVLVLVMTQNGVSGTCLGLVVLPLARGASGSRERSTRLRPFISVA